MQHKTRSLSDKGAQSTINILQDEGDKGKGKKNFQMRFGGTHIRFTHEIWIPMI